ncbi:hypothetical protein HY408_01750 [Candidatus Gottesmanbacteria bacterium]|nr:hypothetical protein [Candidatus Gottesmanbacteria bacterium]
MRQNQTLRYIAILINKLPLLSTKEKEILVKRLEEKTLKKIGKTYQVSGERIRQLEKQALNKVRNKSYQQVLFE